MSIVAPKTSFKIVLDSFNAASFTGNQHNAKFQIDLRTILNRKEQFEKRYAMTVRYEMMGATNTNNNLTPGRLYYLNIDLGCPLNVIYKGATSTPFNSSNNCTVLRFESDQYFFTGTGASQFGGLKCIPSDNAPIIVDNIKNMNSITLSLVDATGNFNFNSPNNATFNANTQYLCVLQFVEV